MEEKKYIEQLKAKTNVELRKEWEREQRAPHGHMLQIEHEMAMRFQKNAAVPLNYVNKWLDLQDQFLTAYYEKDWYRAKYIYETAIVVGMFLEIPDPLNRQMFGLSDPDEPQIQGMIPRNMVSRVYEECVVKDNLGKECVAYRIPGEIGFYGAKKRPGTRLVTADEDPFQMAMRM